MHLKLPRSQQALKALIKKYPFRFYFGNYFLFIVFLSAFVQVYSIWPFISNFLIILVNNLLFTLPTALLIFIYEIGFKIVQGVKYVMYLVVLLLALSHGGSLKIKQKYEQSQIDLTAMQNNLKVAQFKFIAYKKEYRKYRSKYIGEVTIPLVLNEKNEEEWLSCHILARGCGDLSKKELNHQWHTVAYYEENNRKIMFKLILKDGKIIDYTEKYEKYIQHLQVQIFSYICTVLFALIQIFGFFAILKHYPEVTPTLDKNG